MKNDYITPLVIPLIVLSVFGLAIEVAWLIATYELWIIAVIGGAVLLYLMCFFLYNKL